MANGVPAASAPFQRNKTICACGHGTILTAVETKQCQLTNAVVGKWVSGSNGLAERVELACLMKLASWATFFRGLLPVEE